MASPETPPLDSNFIPWSREPKLELLINCQVKCTCRRLCNFKWHLCICSTKYDTIFNSTAKLTFCRHDNRNRSGPTRVVAFEEAGLTQFGAKRAQAAREFMCNTDTGLAALFNTQAHENGDEADAKHAYNEPFVLNWLFQPGKAAFILGVECVSSRLPLNWHIKWFMALTSNKTAT